MDSSSIGITKDALHDWIEEETRSIDIVASWETLCDVYRTLEFCDPLSDSIRMEEYKWIVTEMNKHLSRSRKKLLSCTTPQAVRDALANMFTSTDAKVTNRMDLTYHKLRQMWVGRMLVQLDMMAEQSTIEMEEADGNGREDYWNE